MTKEFGLGVVFCIPTRCTYSIFERISIGYQSLPAYTQLQLAINILHAEGPYSVVLHHGIVRLETLRSSNEEDFWEHLGESYFTSHHENTK